MIEITNEQYENLKKAQNLGLYSNIIVSLPENAKKERYFRVKNSKIKVKMVCTQQGGLFTGSHCFVLAEDLRK